MKKLVLSLVVSFGLSVSANALDMCIHYQNTMVDYFNKTWKAQDLGLETQVNYNFKLAQRYMEYTLVECKPNSEAYKSAKKIYEALKETDTK